MMIGAGGKLDLAAFDWRSMGLPDVGREVPRRLLLACLALAVALTLYNWSPMLSAQWQIIDDHEIVGVIGARDRLPVSEYVTALSSTELADAGQSQRFRVVYSLVRYGEMVVWGKHPQLWYAGRIAMAIAFGLALAWAAVHTGGVLLGAAFVLFELQQTYYVDILGRLAAAEIFALPGLAILTLGIGRLAQGRWSTSTIAMVALGTIVTAGAKENFVVFAAVPLWILGFHWRRLSGVDRGLLFAAVVFVVWIVVTVIRGVMAAGQDFYANDVSAAGRLVVLVRFLARGDVLVWLAGGLAIVGYGWRQRRDAADASSITGLLADPICRNGVVILTLLGLFASQYLFYSGNWPENALGRYRYPGVVALHVAMFLGIVTVGLIARQAKLPARFAGLDWGVLVPVIGAIYLAIGVGHKVSRNRAEAQKIVAESRAFMADIGKVVAELAADPSAAVIMSTHAVIDSEAIASLPQFLRAAGVRNPIAVQLEGYSAASSPKATAGLGGILAESNENLQNNGGGNLVPLSRAKTAPRCYGLGLSGPPSAACGKGIRIYR